MPHMFWGAQHVLQELRKLNIRMGGRASSFRCARLGCLGGRWAGDHITPTGLLYIGHNILLLVCCRTLDDKQYYGSVFLLYSYSTRYLTYTSK